MYKLSVTCVVLVVFLVSEGFGVPQGRRVRQPVVQQQVQQEPHQLDPTSADQGMSHEHAKLIENLQRLKRTLDHVKERVGKGTYGETAKATDINNPESAILTVLKSLQEQGQLFSMINDMLKAGSEVQNQTAKIESFSHPHHPEQVVAEAAHAENTNHIAPAAPVTPTIQATARKDKDALDAGKHHGYTDYQYQYGDDSRDATGDDQYEYQYDAGGYDEAPMARATTTTTTTTTRRPKRFRTRGRNDYY